MPNPFVRISDLVLAQPQRASLVSSSVSPSDFSVNGKQSSAPAFVGVFKNGGDASYTSTPGHNALKVFGQSLWRVGSVARISVPCDVGRIYSIDIYCDRLYGTGTHAISYPTPNGYPNRNNFFDVYAWQGGDATVYGDTGNPTKPLANSFMTVRNKDTEYTYQPGAPANVGYNIPASEDGGIPHGRSFFRTFILNPTIDGKSRGVEQRLQIEFVYFDNPVHVVVR